VVRHEFGTRAAIETNGKQAQVLERGPQSLNICPASIVPIGSIVAEIITGIT